MTKILFDIYSSTSLSIHKSECKRKYQYRANNKDGIHGAIFTSAP